MLGSIVFYNPLSMASKATDDEHRHVGGPVKDGCWYLSFDRIPGIDEHAVHFDISHDVEEPLERYIPQPLAAAVLQPPAAPPQAPQRLPSVVLFYCPTCGHAISGTRVGFQF